MKKIQKIVTSSFHSAFSFLSARNPNLLFLYYSYFAKRQGFKQSRFILSFDCDTEKDIAVVEDVHTRLGKLGITPVYAVPGQLLEKGKDVYCGLANRGVEFINHGYYSHCNFQAESNSYISTFFYDQLTPEIIIDDIQRGHQSIINILGIKPTGFRVPHFGTFQKKENLKFLWTNLKTMGYKYSSSTLPLFGFLNGPLKQVDDDFYEIPLSGCYDFPLQILDSWGFRFAPLRNVTENDYGQQFGKMTSFFTKTGSFGLFNIYADPSQIYDWPIFFNCMELVSNISISSYDKLLKELG